MERIFSNLITFILLLPIFYIVICLNPIPSEDMGLRKIIRIVFNIAVAILCLSSFMYLTNSPTNITGVLTENISVYPSNSEELLLTLPKGLVVKDVTPRGISTIGLLGPDRFSFSFTIESYNDKLIDFSSGNDLSIYYITRDKNSKR